MKENTIDTIKIEPLANVEAHIDDLVFCFRLLAKGREQFEKKKRSEGTNLEPEKDYNNTGFPCETASFEAKKVL